MMKILLLTVLFGFGPMTGAVAADDPARPTTLRDPYVPPAARPMVPAPATQGEALRAQVLAKLKRQFDAADGQGRGSLTRQQAEQGGLGLVATHFDAIDVRGRGAVTFEDLRAYLRRQGADL